MSLELILLILASLLAGAIDSIVGGGGLVLVPALFATFPSTPPATLLGTNKFAAIWGTLISSYQFSKRVELKWALLLPAAAFALAGSLCGAWVVTMINPTFNAAVFAAGTGHRAAVHAVEQTSGQSP
jgi:uncharacterized protein